MSERKTNGWRWLDLPACGALHPGGRWRCERAAGHRNWHSCDNASWAP
jgi:hypothetical protein